MRRFMIMLALICGLIPAGAASAGISYSYVTGTSSAVQSNFSATPGGPALTVDVYLQEVLTGGSTSLIHADGGLYNAAVKQSTFSGTTATITAAALNTANFNPNLGNTNGNNILDQTNLSPAFASGPSFSVVNGNTTNNLYLLGTLTVAPGTSTGATQFNLTAYNGAGGGDTTTYGNPGPGYYDLDISNGSQGNPSATYTGAFANSPTSFTVTVAAVPEPGSMILTGLAGLFVGLGIWLRRRREVAATA